VRLRRDGAIVELKVDKSTVAGYSPDSSDSAWEVAESPLLETVAKEQLLKTQQIVKGLSGCCGEP
jgi:hypothetical protein